MESKQITNEGLEMLAKFKTAQEIKGSLRDALEGVLKFSNAESKPIMGVINSADKNLKPIVTLDQLLFALKKGLEPASLGQFYKGVLKASKTDSKLLEMASKELVSNPVFKEYQLMSELQLRKSLKAKGYSDLGIEAIVKESKVSQVVKDAKKISRLEKKMKKLQNGQTKPLTPTSTVAPIAPKTFTATIKDALLKGISSGWTWKKILIWGTGLGISAATIWWFLYQSETPLPNDIPETEPTDGSGSWLPCIQQMITSKQGVVGKSASGELSVTIKPADYPEGLNYYSNGRVKNLATGDMGSYTCKEKVATINEVVGKILRERLLKEQTEAEVDADVETMINLLDFPVTGSDMQDALKMVQKYAASPMGKDFLLSYKDAGLGGGDLKKSLNYVVTTAAASSRAKRTMLSLISQIESGTAVVPKPDETKTGGGDAGTTIVWDKDKKTGGDGKSGGDGTVVKKKKSAYHDCENKDFPLEYGCTSTKIAEVQKCLGVDDDGKFGPNTMKALVDDKYDTSKGLSKDVYDAVKGNCAPSQRKKLDTNIEPLKPSGLKMSSLAPGSIKLPDLSKMIQSNQPPIDFYNVLKDAGYIRGDASETTLEDGTVIAATKRVKYKGPDLDDEILGKLDGILSTKGYERIKQKTKDYGEKYVWLQK